MFGRAFVLVGMLMLLVACDRAPVAARTVHPTGTATIQASTAPSPTETPSPEPSPTPTPEPSDQPAPAPAAAASAACAASASGSITIGPENYTTGLTVMTFNVSAPCAVTVLLTSDFGMRYSSRCIPSVPCTGYLNDQPPPAARPTGVTYTLTVTDGAGESRTVASAKSRPFNLLTPIPLPGPTSPPPHTSM
jgi:hypothetical protein